MINWQLCRSNFVVLGIASLALCGGCGVKVEAQAPAELSSSDLAGAPGVATMAEPAQDASADALRSDMGPALTMTLLPANPNTAVADGHTTLTAAVQVRSTVRNAPLVGLRMSFSSSNANDSLSPGGTAATDCNGIARVFVSSTQPGTRTLKVTRNRRTLQQSATFTCPGTFLAGSFWSSTGSHPLAIGSGDFNGGVPQAQERMVFSVA
jgi:hypothetical protein